MIRLHTHQDGLATSLSRFVLPIRYELLPWSSHLISTPETSGREFVERAPADLETRSSYLTSETSYALFERAKWFQLTGAFDAGAPDLWESFAFDAPPLAAGQSDRRIYVAVERPVLVLFELDSAYTTFQRGGQIQHIPDPLRLGFLLLDARLGAGGPECEPKDRPPLVLEDLLTFNHAARCIWPSHRQSLHGAHQRIMSGCRSVSNDNGCLRLWEHALGHPLRYKNIAFTLASPEQIRRTRKWVAAAMRSGTDCPPAAAADTGTADSVPSRPESIEVHSGWLAAQDDRAYVWSSASLMDAGDLVTAFGESLEQPERFGHWVRLLNGDAAPGYFSNAERDSPSSAFAAVDSTASNHTSAFQRSWAQARTYTRWAHAGTLYGFTAHSGVQLAPHSTHPPVQHHFETMYFDAVLLLLYVRTVAFTFSAALGRLGAQARDTAMKEDGTEAVRSVRAECARVRRDFMFFNSLYQFPLLSTHQQSVDLYSLARSHMNLESLWREVREEIDATDRVTAAHASERTADELYRLAFHGRRLSETAILASRIGLGLAFSAFAAQAWGLVDPLWTGNGPEGWLTRVLTLPSGGVVMAMLSLGVLVFGAWAAQHAVGVLLRIPRARPDEHAEERHL